MSTRMPDRPTVDAALTLALRAPSVHNSQPWRWRLRAHSLHLYADRSRTLRATDPEGLELLVSCGAALHHARIAFAALGWAVSVTRFPNPAEPDHLAALEFVAKDPTDDQIRLAGAIKSRQTDRRPYASWEVPPGLIEVLGQSAAWEHTSLRTVTEGRQRRLLAAAVAAVSAVQQEDRAYLDELQGWSGHRVPQATGVPAASIPTTPGQLLNRRFPAGTLPIERPDVVEQDAAEFLLLSSDLDDAHARLRAGEATSAVLLEATAIGLATCPMSQALESFGAREELRMQVLEEHRFIHSIVRVGWPRPSAPALPATPRLALKDVLVIEEPAMRSAGREDQ